MEITVNDDLREKLSRYAIEFLETIDGEFLEVITDRIMEHYKEKIIEGSLLLMRLSVQCIQSLLKEWYSEKEDSYNLDMYAVIAIRYLVDTNQLSPYKWKAEHIIFEYCMLYRESPFEWLYEPVEFLNPDIRY